MPAQIKELALPIGLVITLIIAFIGGAAWINSELKSNREAQAHDTTILAKELNAVSSRVASIEANRFTVANGLELWKEIANIKERLAAGEPPKWLKDQLDQINQRLQRIEDKTRP